MVDLIWVDYCLLGLIGLSALLGLFRGLIREVFSLCLWGAAIWLSLKYNRDFSVYFQSFIPIPSVRMVVSFLALFIATLLLGGMLSFLLGKLVASTGLSGTDRLAGFMFGVVRGMLIIALLVMLAGMTPLPEDPWWKQSKLIPPFQTLAIWLRDQMPPSFAAYMKFH